MITKEKTRSLLKLLTLKQVAEYLSISPRTVRRLIKDKDLRVITVGRQKRIDPKDLEAYIKGHRE